MFKDLRRSFIVALVAASTIGGSAHAAPLALSSTVLLNGPGDGSPGFTRIQPAPHGMRVRGPQPRHYRHAPTGRGRSNAGAAVAAGVAGLVIGGLIASQARAQEPRYQTYETYGEPVYAEPRYEEPYYAARRYLEQRHAAPEYYQVEPRRPAYAASSHQHYVWQPAHGLQAWTPEWYDYCSRRYRSFDPRSGTFMGYNGLRQMC
jgi:hypothetical protein